MAVPFGQWSFAGGELSPSLWGHIDLAKFHTGASTARNVFVSYRGGMYSRAGTRFIGYSKQTGRLFPPRLITFQFSINQGLCLEFGNEYMRVIQNGAFVTESPFNISGVTQADPAVVSATGGSAASATPVNTNVVASYAPADLITLAGGTYTVPAILAVTNTALVSLAPLAFGTGYAPADTIVPAGGTQTTPAQLTVVTTQVVSATIDDAGSGGVNGTQTVTGTTGTGTKFQASVTVAGNEITAVLGITVGGSYTVNPTSLSAEPVTGASLSGAKLNVVMGVHTISLTGAGVFTANAPDGNFTQGSTSGGGSGATFQSGIFAPNAVTVSQAGVYTADPSNPVNQLSTTGSGIGAEFSVTWDATAQPFNNGDWVYIANVGGMTELNGNIYVVAGATSTTFELTDVFGASINSTVFSAYTTSGTVARIYTLTTPWGEADLEYLKFTQSADVMSICCWNQMTGTSYQSQDLARFANNSWTLTPLSVGPVIAAPASASAVISSAGTWFYQFVVTAVDPVTGTESVASPAANAQGVNIGVTAGTATVSWASVPGAEIYNVYEAEISDAVIPEGSLFGFLGQSYGTQFNDSNIVPDFQQVPPTYQDPFSPGEIEGLNIITQGSGITAASVVITTSTGSGAVIAAVITPPVNGVLTGYIVINAGKNYAPGDTVAIEVGAGAIAPTATLKIGPQTGTWPSVPGYFQERRVYAASPNQPETYWMSQPGAFTNFGTRIPTIATDAITGNPWGLEVNGIQAMVPVPGALIVFTGLAAYAVGGVGSSAINPQPITPSSQQALPQAYEGCSATVPPIKVNLDILYVQSKNSVIRDLLYNYNYFVNPVGTDITQWSSQLFIGHTIREWAWCEEPYKLVWAVRDDGVMLSLTFLREQEVIGWARSDTQGLAQSVCSVTEPPVDAAYWAFERFIGPNNSSAYTIERMDNRIWSQTEDCWCVDCGVSLAQFEPAATLYPSASLGRPSGANGLPAGVDYSLLTTATIKDPTGTGCAVTLTIDAAGTVTGASFAGGSGYTNPLLVLDDPSGAGRGISPTDVTIILDNSATWSASAGVFSSGEVGNVIRAGGGIAEIAAYIDSEHVVVEVTQPIAEVIPGTATPIPQAAGNWTMTKPVSIVSGLNYLAGQTVTGLADGNVIAPQTVSVSGTITLAAPASDVTVGLGFQAQLQSLYLPEPSEQGQRKIISAVTARLEASGTGLLMGTNQPDGAAQSPPIVAPLWQGMELAPGLGVPAYGSNVVPLYTGDVKIPVNGGVGKPGQVALQQNLPLPLNVLALIPEILPGDNPETAFRQRDTRRAA